MVPNHGEPSYALLARAYGCASICLHRLGSPISEQAGERAALAARSCGDPLLTAAAARTSQGATVVMTVVHPSNRPQYRDLAPTPASLTVSERKR